MVYSQESGAQELVGFVNITRQEGAVPRGLGREVVPQSIPVSSTSGRPRGFSRVWAIKLHIAQCCLSTRNRTSSSAPPSPSGAKNLDFCFGGAHKGTGPLKRGVSLQETPGGSAEPVGMPGALLLDRPRCPVAAVGIQARPCLNEEG